MARNLNAALTKPAWAWIVGSGVERQQGEREAAEDELPLKSRFADAETQRWSHVTQRLRNCPTVQPGQRTKVGLLPQATRKR